MPLTTDGVKHYEWVASPWWLGQGLEWSPDSFEVTGLKIDYRHTTQVPIVHWLRPPEQVEWVYRWTAGGAMPRAELFVVDILSKRRVQIDTGAEPDYSIQLLGWRSEGSEVLFLRMDAEAKKLQLVAANSSTGATRVILTERQDTSISFWLAGEIWFTPLADGTRFVWMSERDGWNHLYLYDFEGTLIRRLTEGPFPVVRVVAVDERGGWVYFTAHGDQQRLYDTHLYRASLDGTGLARLTEATGQHEIHLAPSKQFFIDTHSTVARPPTAELRRADGTRLQILSKASIDALTNELKWRPPEEFVVKAADGKTNLYGVLYKPDSFDPNKKYPVIEVIYAGAAEVPHSFIHPHGVDFHAEHAQALAQLGFITFQVDNRGTGGRGKGFRDVTYGNIGRYEIPDHVAALKQLVEKRPYMDLSRVGIFGHSWGGYYTIRAMLQAPDVYHVGVAVAPAVDLYDLEHLVVRLMGLPYKNKEGYEYGSNLRLAKNLQGKLLLIHGTDDTNDLFSATVKMVDALVRAGKAYDLIVLPEQPHRYTGASHTYLREAIRRYFQEHLKP